MQVNLFYDTRNQDKPEAAHRLYLLIAGAAPEIASSTLVPLRSWAPKDVPPVLLEAVAVLDICRTHTVIGYVSRVKTEPRRYWLRPAFVEGLIKRGEI